jgi:hypothetical protein
VSGQFKKGRSGNPRGRPKGSKNIATIFAEAVCKKVKVRENNEIRTISKMQGVIEVALNKALKGDHHAFAKLMDLAGRLGALESAEPEQSATPRTSALDTLWDLAEKRGLLPHQLDESA